MPNESIVSHKPSEVDSKVDSSRPSLDFVATIGYSFDQHKQASSMNLLFVSSELSSINGDSGLGHLVAHLGGALCALGHKVVAVVPLRQKAVVDQLSFARRLSPISVDLPDNSVDLFVYDGRLPSGVDVKLLEQDELFTDRPAITEDDDEPLRHTVLARAALQLAEGEAKQLGGWHILHAFSLPGSLSAFLAPTYPSLAQTRRVFTIENLEQVGRYDRSWVERLGMSWDDFTPEGIEFYGDLSLMKAGMVSAERLLMSGPTALSSACASRGGEGLEGVMCDRRSDTLSLPPGLDFARWNPTTDVNLSVHYDAEKRDGKVSCKAYLQNRLELPVRPGVPLIALAPPLNDLAQPLADVLEQVLRGDLQLVAPHGLAAPLADAVEQAIGRWPRRIAQLELTDSTWRHMLAGADVLMLDAPEGYEAKHLLAAQRYGALPMVRALGLARDLVVDLSNTLESGNGFLVYDDSPREVLAVVRRACATLLNGQPMQDALGRIMSVNSSWEDRARMLEQAYGELMSDDEG